MNDTEREEDQTLVVCMFERYVLLSLPALMRSLLKALRSDATIYSERVDRLAESLETAILTYHSVATRRKAGSNAFKPVYLPSMKFNDSNAGFSGKNQLSVFFTLHDEVTHQSLPREQLHRSEVQLFS